MATAKFQFFNSSFFQFFNSSIFNCCLLIVLKCRRTTLDISDYPRKFAVHSKLITHFNLNKYDLFN